MEEGPAVAGDGQLAAAVREFTEELCRITFLLDPGEGWYGVFTARDPAGMRDCLEGRRIPPWDVVASLIEDLGRRQGEWAVRRVTERIRVLHAAAAAAHDVRMGGAPYVRDRLTAARRAHADSGQRIRGLEAVARQSPGRSSSLSGLIRARDEHVRAAARCDELERRLAAFTEAPPAPVPAARKPAARKSAERRPRGSRFAGLSEEAAPILPPGAPSPDLSPAVPGTAPRGARFAGSGVSAPVPDPAVRRAGAEELAEARAAAAAVLERLAQLSGGASHVLLCTVAAGPPLHLAVLTGELQDAGRKADADMLLWEAAALPPARLAEVADSLAAIGRGAECGQLLRQSVRRPVGEVDAVVVALKDAGRHREAAQLLTAFVRARSLEEVLQAVRDEPRVLGAGLLEAAGNVSASYARSLVNALHAEGFSEVPPG